MKTRRTPRLSLDLLRGFRAAARHLSFTKAAQELSLTQSAVSQAVKALEGQLGAPLFARVNRTLRLTQTGEHLFRAVDQGLGQIDTAVEEISGAGRALTITSSVPFASMWLGPRLADFSRRYPDISLRLVSSNDYLDLAREQIDIAIRYSPEGASAPPSVGLLCDVEAFPVCSPGLMRDATKPICVGADLARHVWLDLETMMSTGRPWYDWEQWKNAMKIKGLGAAGSLRFSHYDQVIAAAIAGAGIAIGKWPHLASQLQQGLLVAPLGDNGVARLGGFFLVVGDRVAQSPSQAFIEWIRAQMNADIKARAKSMAFRNKSRSAQVRKSNG